MLTILLVITLVNFKIIIGAEISDDKFIDSLPADQKTQFLDKVEQRINEEVPEVKTPSANDTDVDLYEKKLEEQGKSIQNILRTEIDRLKEIKRRNINGTGSRRSNRNEEDRHIDLTLRSDNSKGKPERDGNDKSIKTVLLDSKNQQSDIIPVVVTYDSKSISAEKSNHNMPMEVNGAELKKKNEITWSGTSSTKFMDISNSSVDMSKMGRRLNYIDLSLFENVTQQSPNFNESVDAVGTTKDKRNTSIYNENSNTSQITVGSPKEGLNLSMKMNDNISATENIVVSRAKVNVTSKTENEEDNVTKGNTLVPKNDSNGYTSQKYVNPHQNYADISTPTNLLENSSFTLDKVDTALNPDVLVDSTEYHDDEFLTNEFSNETQGYFNLENVGDSTTQNNVDTSTMLDNVKSTILNNGTVSDDNSTTVISVDSSTIENNSRPSDNMTDTTNIYSSTSEITNDRPANTSILNSTSTVVDSTTNAIESIYAPYVYTNNNNLATTQAMIIKQSENTDHSTIRHTFFDSSLLGNAPHQNDVATMNVVTVKSSNFKVSTNLGDANAKTDDYYHTTTADNINALTDNLLVSTKLSDKNPHAHDDIPSPSASAELGDVFTERYDSHHSTTVDTAYVDTANLSGGIKLGNADTKTSTTIYFMAPMHKDVTLNDSKTENKILDTVNVATNIIHDKKTKLNTGSKPNNTELLKKMYKTTKGKDVGNETRYFTMTVKEDVNMNRVYKMDATKETIYPQHNEDAENYPHYVRIYNYDPNNAYFNADNHHNPVGNTDIGKIGRENPMIIKKIETLSKSTQVDVNLSSPFNTSKLSPKIKVVKDIRTSASNGYENMDVDSIQTVEAQLSDNDSPYEKPFKRGLNKLRKILYYRGVEKKSSNYKSDSYSNQRERNDEYANVETAFNDLSHEHTPSAYKHEAEDLPKGIDDILAQVKKFVDHAQNSETSALYANKNYKDNTQNPDGNIYKDVISSLKMAQNPNLQQLIETLETIEDKANKERNKKSKNKLNKSRFEIKDRNGKYMKKESDTFMPLINPEDIHWKGNDFEESKAITLVDKYVEIDVNSLKDFFDEEDEVLMAYDWLGTTVFIQAGIENLQHMVDSKLHHKRLYPIDDLLLEFIIDLHLTASEIAYSYKEDIDSQRRFSFPRPKPKKMKSQRVSEKRIMNSKKGKSGKRSGHDVKDVKHFLNYLRKGLNDFHTAIKQIAEVTTYRNQHWFRDIKQLYLKSAGAKEYLEVLLHLTTSRLLKLLDESANKLVGEDFEKKNRAIIERIGVEFVRVLRILKELERLRVERYLEKQLFS